MNWITIVENGQFWNIQIPSEVQNNPKAHCNSPEGKKHVAFSDEFLKIDHSENNKNRVKEIDVLMDKYGYKK